MFTILAHTSLSPCGPDLNAHIEHHMSNVPALIECQSLEFRDMILYNIRL
jgi:hypothetical protein